MAAIHAVSPPYPPPTFSQNSTDTSVNGVHMSQPGLNSFEHQRSLASTPTPTPPTTKGTSHMMSFNTASFGAPNGYHAQQETPRTIVEVNGGHGSDSQSQSHPPQIYTAVYSGVSVYEMEVYGVAIMRRRNDSWLNATQILKVAGVDKGKRTKVLEKEILTGEYEKVQGGYGKYQGTWINYHRGVEFCRQYGVEELLRPLLQYDMGQDGTTVAGQGSIETPTKEQAMAAQRKRNMLGGGLESRPSVQSPNGTFFKNISKTAANAVSAINKARFDSPAPRPSSVNKRPNSARRPSQQMAGSQESAFAGSSQQSMQSLPSQHSFASHQLDPALRAQSGPYYTSASEHFGSKDANEPPRKRIRSSFAQSSQQDPFAYDGLDTSMQDLTPTEPADSFYHQQSQIGMDLIYRGLPPLPQPSSNSTIDKQHLLTSLFLDPAHTDFSHHAAFQRLSGEDLDIPIDHSAHTALHWAATLAHTSLVRALIQRGASMFRVNGGGESALIRAALTTNNMDCSTFPELLEILGPTLEIRDGRGRTILHHLAVASAVKGRGSACRYYLESILEFVVRQGSPTNSQANSFQNAQDHNGQSQLKSIGLAKFMAEVVNSPDMSGDTALNLAARLGNKSIIQQLIEVGANPTIPNRGGLKPIDFGVGGDPDTMDIQQPSIPTMKPSKQSTTKVQESSQDLMDSMQNLLTDTTTSFKSELQQKQSLIDQTHAKLRESTSLLNEERRRLEALQQKADKRKELRNQIANLRRANAEHRAQLAAASSMNGTGSGSMEAQLKSDIKIGDADAGLTVDTSLFNTGSTSPTSLTPQQTQQLAALPSVPVLNARTAAYKRVNARLEAQLKEYKSRSSELEAQMKKIVGICTGVGEEKVDEMLDGLQAAVDSERGEEVEVGRVREFLRKVEEAGSPP